MPYRSRSVDQEVLGRVGPRSLWLQPDDPPTDPDSPCCGGVSPQAGPFQPLESGSEQVFPKQTAQMSLLPSCLHAPRGPRKTSEAVVCMAGMCVESCGGGCPETHRSRLRGLGLLRNSPPLFLPWDVTALWPKQKQVIHSF